MKFEIYFRIFLSPAGPDLPAFQHFTVLPIVRCNFWVKDKRWTMRDVLKDLLVAYIFKRIDASHTVKEYEFRVLGNRKRKYGLKR
jgi:hypothetical protein